MDRMAIGLIGYGYWGPNVARKIEQNRNFSFRYICDLTEERLEKARQLYREQLSYTGDYHDLLQDESVQAVAIAVNTESHYQIAKDALQAGKHVYIEKPFTSTSRQGKELQRLAEERDLIIHVDHIMIYHPIIRDIKHRMETGEIGEIMYFDCSRINLGKVKDDVNSMWDLSVHDLSIIDYLSDGLIPKEIKCAGGKFYSARETVTSLVLKYDSFIANMTASWLSPIKERRIIIGGTKEMIVFNDMELMNKYIIYDKGFDIDDKLSDLEYEKFALKTRNSGALVPEIPQEDALYNSLEHFRECVVKGQASLSGPPAANRLTEILEEADKQLNMA